MTDLADHKTPLIRQEWYVAALSDEITRDLRSRQILGVGVLLYRTENGDAVALRNRCPHRSFPLSHGKLVGDTVVCGYHGIAFGADGRCADLPSQASIPEALKTHSFPVVDRAPFVWIWMGDPDRADPALIPDHSWLASPNFTSVTGYMHCRTNYVRLHENVLDLTHFPYVHNTAIGDLDYIRTVPRIEQHGNSVVIKRVLENKPLTHPLFARSIGNNGHRCDRTSESWFISPAFHVAHARIEDLEGGVYGRTRFNFEVVHCLTPETAHTTHYIYAVARDSSIDDTELTAFADKMTRATFIEDEEALELVERTWIEEDEAGYRETSVRGDTAGLRMRRIIANRAAAEAEAR